MKKSFILLLILISSFSCSNEKSQNLPPASGRSGDMYLMMDATQWKGDLGVLLDSVFNAEMQGLPRDERIFHMRWIDPVKLNFVLKQGRNLVFVSTLDQKSSGSAIINRLFTQEVKDKIKTDPDFYVRSSSNVFAKGQEVMYLFGNNQHDLIQNIRKNKQKLVEHFNRTERERLTVSLFKKEVKGVGDWLQKNFQANLRVPFGYKLVTSEQDFLWVRQINPRDDKDVFIARKKYISPEQFKKENIISFRDEICKKYLFEDPDRTETYLITETTVPFIPVESKQINFNNQFAIETRGLWRTNNLTMGGPFHSIALVDESTGWFYYLEGFTFCPGKDQREIMRELETVLYTFRTSDQLPAPKKAK